METEWILSHMVRHGIGSFIRFQATLGVGINGYSRIGNAVWVYYILVLMVGFIGIQVGFSFNQGLGGSWKRSNSGLVTFSFL